MHISRRSVVGALGVATFAVALPASAQPTAIPRRIPLREFANNATMVDALRRGVRIMRSRPPSDPTSWFFQSAIHAHTARAYGDALLRDEKVGQVDRAQFWNRCPHGRRYATADFLLWHRAYIYYFERILRAAAGEPMLALPYWDYTYRAKSQTPAELQLQYEALEFPELFREQFLDQSQSIANSLFEPSRNGVFAAGMMRLNEQVTSGAEAMAASVFFTQLTPTVEIGLAGAHDVGSPDQNLSTLGRIEESPHNDLHISIGGFIDDENGAMASVPTAAFDPVFWVHHAKVDQMWTRWSATPGKKWGRMPPAAWLDARPWSFHDHDKTVKNEMRRNWLDHRTIGTAYDTDVAGEPYLTLPSAQIFASMAPVRGWSVAGPLLVVAGSPTALPPEGETRIVLDTTLLERAKATQRQFTSGARRPRATILLSDVSYETAPTAGHAVLLSTTNAAGRTDLRQLGRLALFGGARRRGDDQSHHAEHDGQASDADQVFDVTEALRGLDTLTGAALVFRPYDLLSPMANASPERRDGKVLIASINLRFAVQGDTT